MRLSQPPRRVPIASRGLRSTLAAVLVGAIVLAGGAGAAYAQDAAPSPEPSATETSVTETASPEPAPEASGPAPDESPAATEAAPGESSASESSVAPTADDSTEPSPSSPQTFAQRVLAPLATSTIVHTGKAYTYAEGVAYYVPEQVTVGEPIHVSGSGWTNTAGDAGSIVAVKLDDGGVSTKLSVTNPASGAVQPNKTIVAIAQADANGDWEVDVPWPTLDNSDKAWSAGETHNVRLLTGSLLTGDAIRTAAGEFTTVAASPAVAPAVTSQPSAAAVVAGQDAVFSAAAAGTPTPSVRWQARPLGGEWADVAGATEATLTVSAATTTQSGTDYRAVFTNAAGSVTTDAARLIATSITLDKTTYAPGETISFAGAGYVSDDGAGGSLVFLRADGLSATSASGIVEATWGGPDAVTPGVSAAGSFPTFRTRADGTFSGTVTLRSTVSETGPGTEEHEGQHSLTIASNPVYGNPMPATTTQAWFTVDGGATAPEEPEPADLPVIIQQPADALVWSNATSAQFNATAALDPAPTSAQWQYLDGGTWRDIPGESYLLRAEDAGYFVAYLYLSASDPADAAYLVDGARFRVVFANDAGTVASEAATVTIKAAPEVTVDSAGPYQRGDAITVSGSGFTPGIRVYVDLLSPSVGIGRVTERTDDYIQVGVDGRFANVELALPLLRWVGVDESDDGSFAAADDYVLQFTTWNQGAEQVTVQTAPFAIVDPAGGSLPTIVAQPQSVTTTAGAPATFGVEVTGDPEPVVYWQTNTGASPYNWTTLTAQNSGATWQRSSQTTVSVRAVVANAVGWVVSDAVKLTVAPAAPPAVVSQPVDVTTAPGTEATFTAAASGVPAPTVQWQSSADGADWSDVAGATATTLTVPVEESTASGTRYRAVFANASGTATTNAATLTVSREQAAPAVIAQPQSTSVAKGDTATFAAAASGAPTPAVQWWSKTGDAAWTIVAGATGTTLTLANTTAAQSGTQYKAVFTNAAGTAETDAATLTVAANATKTYTGTSDPSVTFTVPTEVAEGEDITISGTGWKTTAGTEGSVIGVKLDDGAVSTTREVVNPANGAVQSNKTIWAIAQADASGDWTATFPYPTTENSDATWKAGETHSVRLLTGSLVTGDKIRTEAASFTIAGDAPSGPADPPAWAHETVTYTDPATGNTATAWVQEDVDAGDGSSIRIKGTGWVDQAGTGASTVALKLNHGDGQQYTRSGDGIVQHPSATGDDTIWVLLAPSNPQDHPNVIAIDADGNFEVEIDAPDGLAAGQYLSVLFQSGRFDSADIQRTVTTGYLTVGGVPYEGGGSEEEVTCATDSAPSITIENPSVSLGGVLHVTGAGWCHPAENRGGSTIAFKLDEGAYSRLTPDVHQNLTVWAMTTANAADGTFDLEIRLPDGSTSGANGSSPAFAEGAHSLRLLTGSLKSGDAVRTLQSSEFVVGAYRPNGAPDPVDAETLTDANRNGVALSTGDASLTVTVPGAQEGDWIFVTPYAEDGSPRFPWLGTWFQVDASGTVVLPLAGATLPVGTVKVAVQSGDQGEVGALLGWGWLTVDAPPAAGGDGSGDAGAGGGTAVVPETASNGTTTPGLPVYTLASRTASQQAQAPSNVPAAPFETDEGLTPGNAGDVTGVQDGTVVTITLPGSAPGDWVYLYAYSKPVAVGWIQVDENRQVRVDVAALPAGAHKIAVLDADGGLVGWTSATVTAAESTVTTTDDDDSAAQSGDGDEPVTATPISAEAGGLSAADWWLIGGGAAIVLAALAIVLVVVSRRRRVSADGAGGGER